jgi:Cu(I)/Ag(I) efflux system protein CusF
MNTESIYPANFPHHSLEGLAMKKTYRTHQLFAILAVCLSAAPGGHAQAPLEHAHLHTADPAVSTPIALSMGEVVKVDRELAKITLRHGPLENLAMPGMTMVFRVAEPAMLEQVKPGDKVRFLATKSNGALTIVTLQVSGE